MTIPPTFICMFCNVCIVLSFFCQDIHVVVIAITSHQNVLEILEKRV